MNNLDVNHTHYFDWDKHEPTYENLINHFEPEAKELLKKFENCYNFNKSLLEPLVSKEGIDRYKGMLELFINDFHKLADRLETNKDSYVMMQWIHLGSLLEATLQLFLIIYIEDYKKTYWQVWTKPTIDGDVEILQFDDNVKKEIFNFLNELECKSKLTKQQKNCFKNLINDKIKFHTRIKDVDKIMLDNLIQLCNKENIFKDEYIKVFKQIQKNRNGIHLISEREMDGYDELVKVMYMVGSLFSEMQIRLPNIEPEYY